jgi:MFS family permease
VPRILNNTGRVNVGQGALMTVPGVGASLSPAIGGWIAQEIGFAAAFMILGSFSIISIVLRSVFIKTLKPACAPSPPAKNEPASCDGNNTLEEQG